MTKEQEQRLIAAAGEDAFYRELLAQCGALEEEYSRIKEILTEKDRYILERYISLCEEMEYRQTVQAFALGTQEGLRTQCGEFAVEK